MQRLGLQTPARLSLRARLEFEIKQSTGLMAGTVCFARREPSGGGYLFAFSMKELPDLQDYVRRILTSSVYDVAVETPLERMKQLSARLGVEVLLKREDLQPVFAFKIRGAQNKIATLTAAERARGVICASAGNHAQGVALSASRLGVRAVLVMPTTTPTIKVRSVDRKSVV